MIYRTAAASRHLFLDSFYIDLNEVITIRQVRSEVETYGAHLKVPTDHYEILLQRGIEFETTLVTGNQILEALAAYRSAS